MFGLAAPIALAQFEANPNSESPIRNMEFRAPLSPAPERSGQFFSLRPFLALVMREVAATHGRSSLGYLWAVLEPVGGIIVMSIVFSLAFRTPVIGTNFALFFASGLLPFVAFTTLQSSTATAIKNSRPLMQYPRVSFIDALLARVLVAFVTQSLVASASLIFIIVFFDLDVFLDVPKLVAGFALAGLLGVSVGSVNCFLFTVAPLWERVWGILTRPLMIVSGVLFPFHVIPMPYRDYIWWNPIIQTVGVFRDGIYATYDASYVSFTYVSCLSMGLLFLGTMLLHRFHRDLLNY